jgi:hypothetical protein
MLESLSTLRLALRWLGRIISCGVSFSQVVRLSISHSTSP